MLTVLQHFRLLCELISRHKSRLSWSKFCINLRTTYIQQWSTSTTHTYPSSAPMFRWCIHASHAWPHAWMAIAYGIDLQSYSAPLLYAMNQPTPLRADCTHVSTVWSRSAASLTGVSASRLTTAVDIGYCLWCRRWYISLLHVLLLWRQLLWVVHVYV